VEWCSLGGVPRQNWPSKAIDQKQFGNARTQAYGVSVSRNDEALVTIATFSSSFEASMVRGVLEAIGIPALVPDESSGTFSTYSRKPDGSGGSVLKVFESDRDRAIAELRRLQMHITKPPSEAV